jgi:hypothetical protein
MMRYLSACVVLALAALPASAHFGIFRRPAEVVRASYYYVPPTYYYVPPVVCVPPAVAIEVVPPSQPPPLPQPLPAQPPAPVTPPNRATPQPAPATPPEQVPPLPPPAQAIQAKKTAPYFDVYPSGGERPTDTNRKVVTFWNLSAAALTVQIDGQNQVLAPKSSQTFRLPGAFAWRVEGREPEASRVGADEAGITIMIRR